MNSILVACVSGETAERGLRMAAGLSVACGARLSLVYAPDQTVAVDAAAGMDAIGHLSNVLFAPQSVHSHAPSFASRDDENWLASMHARVDECWEASHHTMPSLVRKCKPDLVVTCDGRLARMLVADTNVPVWHVRAKHRERAWFSMRKLRCAVRGSRAADWAGAFAKGLGVELETIQTSLLRAGNADLVVLPRESRASLMSARAIQPVVVV